MIKRLLRLVGRWVRKPVNHTSWVVVVTPTDRPKSVRNRCLIELFCGVVCVVTLPFRHFCWCRGFCHRTESDLFLFLVKVHGYFIPTKFHQNPSSAFGEVENVKSLYTDGRTDGRSVGRTDDTLYQ